MLGAGVSFGEEDPSGSPEPFEHVNEVEDEGNLDLVSGGRSANASKLRIVAVDQNDPRAFSFRVAAEGFLEGVLGDRLGTLVKASPDPLVARPRRQRRSDGLGLVHDLFGGADVGRDGVDRGNRRHSLAVALFSAAQSTRELVAVVFGTLACLVT